MNDRAAPETLKDHINGRLLTRGNGKAWQNILVQLLAHESCEERLFVPAVAEPLLVWIISGAATIEERELEGKWLSNEVSVGDFFLTNSPTPYEMRWRTTGPERLQVLHVYLGLPIYEAAVAELYGANGGSGLQLRDVSGEKDPKLSNLLEMVHAELVAKHEPSEMYVQGLASALAIHLVRNYTDRSAPVVKKGALQAFKLRRVTDAMRDALREEFRLETYASEAGLSTFHFSRAFKQSTGFSPSQYFTRLRMDEARKLLRYTEKSVLEVSMEVGYASPSHFAQVFKKQVGVNPSDYRS
ncbi:AraC family transcriptional regulator [Sinorhizobium meliloti CCNWSX0020]|uniref:AraC family transcriptional regulator n=1 Tax=Sinorhizobium meliloti CCNWSX0020 TaxID=1107881 RepID=H0G2G5_RHIML|nr:AraC family transcriptional regulator [Sinorhizobium meliloti]EHK76522.1 AraC family transcriptional regulator [Sinorhizobium meliloti CCNWSX0020]